MNTHTLNKTTALDSALKQCPVSSVKNKGALRRKPHKVSHLYETPFSDVVTNEYVRGYN